MDSYFYRPWRPETDDGLVEFNAFINSALADQELFDGRFDFEQWIEPFDEERAERHAQMQQPLPL